MAAANETLRDLIARAVAEKGEDYIYPEDEKDGDDGEMCRYFYDGRPSCIIGHVLSYLGIDEAVEGAGAEVALDGLGFSYEELRAADEAQTAQDEGCAWGQALISYDRALARWSKITNGDPF